MLQYVSAAVLLTLLVGSALMIDRRSAPVSATGTAIPTSRPASRIYALGIVEGRTEAVELQPELAGRVAEVLVCEGDWVEKGEVLVRIDARQQAQQVAICEANLCLAQANLDRLINGARDSERREALALLAVKKSRLDQERTTWTRIEKLRDQSAVSQQEADDQKSQVETLTAELEAAQARVDQLEAAAREDEVRAAEARVAAARAELELALIVLEKAELRAPCRGQILSVDVEPGELVHVNHRPAIALADTSRLRVRAYIEELDAPRVHVGMPAEITADGLDGQTIEATVQSISPLMKTKTLTHDRPSEHYDTKVREMILEISPQVDTAELIVGLRVDVLLDSPIEPMEEESL